MSPVRTEDPRDACAAILNSLIHEEDAVRRAFLLADLTNKLDRVPADLAAHWRNVALKSLLFRGPREVPLEFKGWAPAEEVDVTIVVVTPVELRAAITVFDIDENDFQVHNGRRYYRTVLSSVQHDRNLSLVLTSVNFTLNVRAAKAIMEIKSHFDANCYFLLGIAAGNRNRVCLGDVVIPEQVMYYEAGRQLPDQFKRRGQWNPTPSTVVSNIRYYDQEETDYYARLSREVQNLAVRDRPDDLPDDFRPSVKKDNTVIISGEKLIQDGVLRTLQEEQDEGIVAGDQEAFGFAYGLEGCRWGIFRGISDWGEEIKPNSWQFVAVLSAGLLLRDFLETQFRLEIDPQL